MYTDDADAAYLQKRLDTSLDMSRTAACDCSRVAHRSLAMRYEQQLVALRQAVTPS